MDLLPTIQYLYEEKAKLERAIASLEELQRATESGASEVAAGLSRRGRKSMGPQERLEVAERMRKYWASQRTSADNPSKPSGAATRGRR